jgi:hypothetical protein
VRFGEQKIMTRSIGIWVGVFAVTLLAAPAKGQDAKCGEPGFQYLGQLNYSTNADSGSDTKTTALKPGFVPDASYQQATIKAAGGGSGAVSDLSPEDIPKGFKLIISGTESSCKGWAVLRPLKLTVEELDGIVVKQFGFSAKMYCTRGSGESCKNGGGCDVKMDICGRPASEPKPTSDKKTGADAKKTTLASR